MSVQIPLSRGLVATVDESDEPLVGQRKWHVQPISRKAGGYYAVCGRRPKHAYMHRLLLDPGPGQEVDHINGDGLDNRRSNLRIATRSQNNANRDLPPGASGFRGVYIERTRHNPIRYRAQVGKEPNRFRGPLRKTPAEAAHDYDAEALRRFGQFARLNFPMELAKEPTP